MSDHTKNAPTEDLSVLIRQALDDRPPTDLPDRVMAKLAFVATAVELFRLAAEAPLSALANESDIPTKDDRETISDRSDTSNQSPSKKP